MSAKECIVGKKQKQQAKNSTWMPMKEGLGGNCEKHMIVRDKTEYWKYKSGWLWVVTCFFFA